VLGAAVGFGFAALESSGYALNALIVREGRTVVFSLGGLVTTELLRGILAPVGHGLWTALLGGVLFAASRERPDASNHLSFPSGHAAITFAALLFAVAVDRIDRHQSNHVLWQAIYARSRSPQVAAYRILEPSWVFYGNREVREITAAPPSSPQLAAEQAVHFLSHSTETYLITTRQKLTELSPLLPSDVQVVAQAPYFLKRNQELVVLTRHPEPIAILPHPVHLY
jgi:hypothetical protein